VVLAHLNRRGLIPGLNTEHIQQAMEDLLSDTMLTANLQLLQAA
jgi:hypothetical protein